MIQDVLSDFFFNSFSENIIIKFIQEVLYFICLVFAGSLIFEIIAEIYDNMQNIFKRGARTVTAFLTLLLYSIFLLGGYLVIALLAMVAIYFIFIDFFSENE